MQEQKVLASVLHSRPSFEKIARYLEASDFSAAGNLILESVREYYTTDPSCVKVDPLVLAERIKRALPNEKQSDAILAILRSLKPEISSENVAQDYLELKRQGAGDKLAAAIGARRSPADIAILAERYNELRTAAELDLEPEEVIEDDWAKLIAGELNEETKIKLLPGKLNALLGGGVRRGDCVVLFGRPNSGKSLFCINAASGFINQGLKVLWIENEDRGNKTKLRFGRRLIGLSDSQLKADPEAAAAEIEQRGAGRFIYASLTPGTLVEIESLVRTHKPDVFIVNQIRNISMKAESFTRQLDLAAQKCRSLGKKYSALSILVTQAHAPANGADGYAKDKPVLYMEDVDSSRTGLAASADVMIGYGTSHQLREDRMACLNVCKSKYGPEEHFYCKVNIEIDKLISQKEQGNDQH